MDLAPIRILLVEDNDDIAYAIASLLEEYDYVVTRARNGSEACEALQSGLRPALILLDLMMPVMNGEEFLAMRESSAWAQIPVVVMTAAGMRSVRIQDVENLLLKPIRGDVLLDALRGIVPTEMNPLVL